MGRCRLLPAGEEEERWWTRITVYQLGSLFLCICGRLLGLGAPPGRELLLPTSLPAPYDAGSRVCVSMYAGGGDRRRAAALRERERFG